MRGDVVTAVDVEAAKRGATAVEGHAGVAAAPAAADTDTVVVERVGKVVPVVVVVDVGDGLAATKLLTTAKGGREETSLEGEELEEDTLLVGGLDVAVLLGGAEEVLVGHKVTARGVEDTVLQDDKRDGVAAGGLGTDDLEPLLSSVEEGLDLVGATGCGRGGRERNSKEGENGERELHVGVEMR